MSWRGLGYETKIVIRTNNSFHGNDTGCHFLSFVMFISGAKVEEYCFNISRDFLFNILPFRLKTSWRHHFPSLHNAKAFQIRSNCFSCYIDLKYLKSVKCWMFGGRCAELRKRQKQLQLLRSEREFNTQPPFSTLTISPACFLPKIQSHFHYFFYSNPSDPNFLFPVNK